MQPHKLDLFLWENGARNCSIVGATFWRNFEVVVKLWADVRCDDTSGLARVVRRQVEQIHVLAPNNLRREVGLVSTILISPRRCSGCMTMIQQQRITDELRVKVMYLSREP